ncbi:unnamed protein product [Withania somnifera]
MAVLNSFSTPFLVTKLSSTGRRTIRLPAPRLLVLASSHENISINTSISSSTTTTITNPLQIRLTSKNTLNKVYEDKSRGVVCYRDENGEILCEGYDEGPRLCHQLPESPSKSIDEEIVELLQRNWLNEHIFVH